MNKIKKTLNLKKKQNRIQVNSKGRNQIKFVTNLSYNLWF